MINMYALKRGRIEVEKIINLKILFIETVVTDSELSMDSITIITKDGRVFRRTTGASKYNSYNTIEEEDAPFIEIGRIEVPRIPCRDVIKLGTEEINNMKGTYSMYIILDNRPILINKMQNNIRTVTNYHGIYSALNESLTDLILKPKN